MTNENTGQESPALHIIEKYAKNETEVNTVFAALEKMDKHLQEWKPENYDNLNGEQKTELFELLLSAGAIDLNDGRLDVWKKNLFGLMNYRARHGMVEPREYHKNSEKLFKAIDEILGNMVNAWIIQSQDVGQE